MPRTFRKLGESDLRGILSLALEELKRFLNASGKPPGKYRVYGDRLVAVCLAQGAAQHYVDMQHLSKFDADVGVSEREIKKNGLRVLRSGRVMSGVKDIDVFFFFRGHKAVRIPVMRHCRKSELAPLGQFGTRTFNFMKKAIPHHVVQATQRPSSTSLVRTYLQLTVQGRKYLSQKSLVGLYPPAIFGKPLWAVRRFTANALKKNTTSAKHP